MVLEYFAACKLRDNFQQEKFEVHPNNQNMDILTIVSALITLTISFLTAKLAYDCNKKAKNASKIVVSIFAFFFSWSYLLYYFVWHLLLGNKC